MITVGNDEARKMESILKKQKSEYQNKLKKCKARFGMGDINEDVYETTNQELQKLSLIHI